MELNRQRKAEGLLFLIAFTACVPAANWLVGNVGTACSQNGPCVVPVAPRIVAPSGVLMIGLALVLRDFVERRLGAAWALVAIGLGAIVSAGVSPPSLVLASTAAFLISELADFAVYTPLQRRGLLRAVVASSAVGILVDSVVFLHLAFGSLDFLLGQVIGKAWMVVLAIPIIARFRERDERLTSQPT